MGSLRTKLKGMIDPSYYADGYKQMIRDHLRHLIESEKTAYIEIEPSVAENATGDLTSILRHYDLDPILHWPVCVMNSMDSPMQYNPSITHLYVPDRNEILAIHRYHSATQTM